MTDFQAPYNVLLFDKILTMVIFYSIIEAISIFFALYTKVLSLCLLFRS